MSEPRDADAQRIAAGYATTGPALDLGAVVLGAETPKAYPDAQVRVALAMVNRHGLIAGATGTGKTKTLQGLAEQLVRSSAAALAEAGHERLSLRIPEDNSPALALYLALDFSRWQEAVEEDEI